MPFAGVYQLTPEEGMAAKLPVLEGKTDNATAMTFGFIPGISRWSPFHGAAFAVVLSLAKLAAMGVDTSRARLTFQEYFEKLRNHPERWESPPPPFRRLYRPKGNGSSFNRRKGFHVRQL